jgi:hypothetical protein
LKLIALLILFTTSLAFSQTRIAVMPLENMDGKMEKNIWCYQIQDSIYKVLVANLKKDDPDGKKYQVVSQEEIEDELAKLNIDPSNPQYKSDMWKALANLKVKKVILGNFNLKGDKFLLNFYIYDVKMKLANQEYQIRDLFRNESELYSIVPEVIAALYPFFQK